LNIVDRTGGRQSYDSSVCLSHEHSAQVLCVILSICLGCVWCLIVCPVDLTVARIGPLDVLVEEAPAGSGHFGLLGRLFNEEREFENPFSDDVFLAPSGMHTT
jgi:ferredoxin